MKLSIGNLITLGISKTTSRKISLALLLSLFSDYPQPYLDPDPFHSHPVQPSKEVAIQGYIPYKTYPSIEDDQDLGCPDEYIMKTCHSWINHWDFPGNSNFDLSKENDLSFDHLAMDQGLKGHHHDTVEETFSSPSYPLEPFPSFFVPLPFLCFLFLFNFEYDGRIRRTSA